MKAQNNILMTYLALLIICILAVSCSGLNLEHANKALSVVQKVSFEGDSLALTTADLEVNFELNDLSEYGQIANVIDTNGVRFNIYRSPEDSVYRFEILIPSRKVKIPLRRVE